jgi:pullulanase
MRKWFLIFTMMVLVSVLFAGTELIIHYYRFDNRYEGWNLWIWGDGVNGQPYPFTEEDGFGMVARITLNQSFTRTGVIVRLGEWLDKDVAEDRFVDTANGFAEVYLLQNVKEIFTEEPDISPRIFFCGAVSNIEIRAYMTGAFDTKEWQRKVIVTVDGKEREVIEVSKVIPTDISITNFIKVKLKNPLSDEDIASDVRLSVEGFLPAPVVMMGILDSLIDNREMGVSYSADRTTFRVWSPVSRSVTLKLYEHWDDTESYSDIEMVKDPIGTWSTVVDGDQKGKFYLFEYENYGKKRIGVDPYSKAVAKNSVKSAIVDLRETNPLGWDSDISIGYGTQEDAIIYEIHIADVTGLENSNVKRKATYLGLIETGTKSPEGYRTGIDHIKELGVTHVHILPFFDFYTGDEAIRDFESMYNWGYDPYLFMTPEGRYASDPFTPETRIKEVKQMVKGFHDNGLNVVMDIVFPHTFGVGELSPFDQSVPFYFYKISKNGSYINESGCGNTIASHRPMMRKFILAALEYWVKEYHIDGFRFDQMGFMDITTMTLVEERLKVLNPNILLYGEGWGDAVALDYWGKPENNRQEGNTVRRLVKTAVAGTTYAAFNDEIRDAVRGSVFEPATKGYVMGSLAKVKKLKSGVVGSIDFSKTEKGFADDPQQTINYAACHDNHTLWDKNALAAESDGSFEWNEEYLIRAQKLAGAIILTAQGIPFLHGGQEFCRTKYSDGNSYASPISINGFDYARKAQFIEVFAYYKGLIALRKAHPSFRLKTADEIRDHLVILSNNDRMVVSCLINALETDSCNQILVLLNGNTKDTDAEIPDGPWGVVADSRVAGTDVLYMVEGGTIKIPGTSAFIMVR